MRNIKACWNNTHQNNLLAKGKAKCYNSKNKPPDRLGMQAVPNGLPFHLELSLIHISEPTRPY